MSPKIGSVKEADLILRGEEKEAYLEFVERGGFAEMRKEIFSDLEEEKEKVYKKESNLNSEKHYLRYDYEKLELYTIIRNAIEKAEEPVKDELDGKKILHTFSYVRGIKSSLRLDDIWAYNNRGEVTKYYNELFMGFKEYTNSDKDSQKKLLEYEFAKHYKLLHENLAKDKELTKVEYNQKLERYKNKVRKSFWRNIFNWRNK